MHVIPQENEHCYNVGLRVFRTLGNEPRCFPINRSIVRVERLNYYVSTSHRGCLNYLYDR